jgi:hypothetical protein
VPLFRNYPLKRWKNHLPQRIVVSRAAFLVQDGSFHRLRDIQNNGSSFGTIARTKHHRQQRMAIARAPFLARNGCFHRSSDIKHNGCFLGSIARKIKHLSKLFVIARWSFLLLESHVDLHVQKVHCAWLPWRLRDGPLPQARDINVK